MAGENKHFSPCIDFYDVDGNECRVVEIVKDKTLEGYERITYKLINGKEVSFVIKKHS